MVSRRRRERVANVANVLCAIALIVFALVILAGWFDPGHAARKPTGHGCRNAQRCHPPTPAPTSTPTPIAPGCVEFGPDCVIDLTGSWPTTPPVVIVQTFPSPYELP